jgi:hypothetical protein
MQKKSREATSAPDIDLTDEVWTLQHIAKHVKLSLKGARVLVSHPDFPKPLLCQQRNRRWLKSAVMRHLALISEGAFLSNHPVHIDASYEPRSIMFKGRKSAA